MSIDLQRLIDNPLTVRFVSALARIIPPPLGYPICDRLGKWVATRHESSLTQAVRLNQWMARGANLTKEELDDVLQETLQNNVRDLYDLHRQLDHPEETWRRTCSNPLAEELVRRPEFAGRGLMLVGVHMSGFDAVVLSMHRRGAQGLVLTIPDPQGGRRVEFEMRRRTGMKILPASLETLRQAVAYLKRGGLVLTAIDRPVAAARLHPRFFGQPSHLSTHFIYLALKARVPVVTMAVIRQQDGKYKIVDSEFLEMESHADHETAMLQNAERVLKQAERFIRLAPQQWNVPLPVWPELLGKVPG